MLKKLIVNNYKSLVGFHCEFEHINLIIGPNGSGKSAVFEVLSGLKEFVTGTSPVSIFPSASLTKWETGKDLQTFALHIEGNGGAYEYSLSVAHDRQRDKQRVQHEIVSFDGHPLYRYDGDHMFFFQDDNPDGRVVLGSMPFMSGLTLSVVDEDSDYTKLVWLKGWFRDRLLCYRLDPNSQRMMSMLPKEETALDQTGANFVGWLRHIALAKPDVKLELDRVLTEMYGDRFSSVLDKEGGTVRHLFVNLHVKDTKPIKLGFEELSDGERALFVLYALLHLARDPNTTLFLDEPDNYVALQEIQPWLVALKEATEEVGSQALLISHHPEMIDYLAPDCGILFDRVGNGRTETSPFPTDVSDGGLSASEIIARGWQ